jgi:hypothetical protein
MAERDDTQQKHQQAQTPADVQALADAAVGGQQRRPDGSARRAAATDAGSAAPQEDQEVMRRFVDDEDADEYADVSLKSILGGDILQSRFFQRQVLFILFCAFLMIFYTGNRYASQQDIILLDSLKVQVEQERYRVLTQSSELLNLSRQSHIEKQLILNGDTALKPPVHHPFEITKPTGGR